MARNELILWRGISVSEDNCKNVIYNIRTNGFSEKDNSTWKNGIYDIKKLVNTLIEKPNLTRRDTKNPNLIQYPVVSACGDRIGAEYYALQHNKTERHKTPIIIKFKTSIQEVFIDGKDFLYTCFQLFDRKSNDNISKITRALVDLFGKPILKYFELATKKKDTQYRIALCDLAVQDDSVILSHYKNKKVIHGRYGTIFSSAFFCKLPITKERIIKVKKINKEFHSPRIDYNLGGLI